MDNYLKAVTLGAFTWKNEERLTLLFAQIRKTKSFWLFLHFIIITFALSFPVTFQIARLSPIELYSRLYGENFLNALPQTVRSEFEENEALGADTIENFNSVMIQNNYGRNMLLPILSFVFFILLLIQGAFYFSACFFLGFSRMNITRLTFHDRMGLALFTSTLPVLICSLFGLYLPTVHIIIFYLIIIILVFQRSNLCPNG